MGNRPGGWLYADDQVLRGVTLALKKVDREAKKEWAKAMRTFGSRVWASAVARRAVQPQDAIFGRASVSWSMGGKGTAKVKPRPLSGTLGEAGARDMRFVDFGSPDPRLPRPFPTGRVVYGALQPFGSWMGQMALKTLADTIRDATRVD